MVEIGRLGWLRRVRRERVRNLVAKSREQKSRPAGGTYLLSLTENSGQALRRGVERRITDSR
jgi:hypothetical protein